MLFYHLFIMIIFLHKISLEIAAENKIVIVSLLVSIFDMTVL
jgi:hypothetical protein